MHYKYDAIVCLGGNVEPSGRPGKHGRLRVERALKLYKDGVSPLIVFSGKSSRFRKSSQQQITEAQAMANYAISLGLPPKAVLLEDMSASTVYNAYNLKHNFLNQYNLRTLLVVTSPFHLSRTKLIFNKIMGDAAVCEYHTSQATSSPIRHLVKELLLIAYTRIALLGVKRGDDESVVQRLRLFLKSE